MELTLAVRWLAVRDRELVWLQLDCSRYTYIILYVGLVVLSHSWARRLNCTIIIVVDVIVVATVHWVDNKKTEHATKYPAVLLNHPHCCCTTIPLLALPFTIHIGLSSSISPMRTSLFVLLVIMSIHVLDILAIISIQGKPIPRELLLQPDTQYVPAPDFPTRTIDLYRICFSISKYLPAFTYYAPALFQTWTQTHRLIPHTSEPIR